MPYDDRPVSEGGNRGIGELFSRKAPPDKFQIVGVDTFDGGDWVVTGDDWKPLYFDKVEDAIALAREQGGSMDMRYVYDDQGTCLFKAGTF